MVCIYHRSILLLLVSLLAESCEVPKGREQALVNAFNMSIVNHSSRIVGRTPHAVSTYSRCKGRKSFWIVQEMRLESWMVRKDAGVKKQGNSR